MGFKTDVQPNQTAGFYQGKDTANPKAKTVTDVNLANAASGEAPPDDSPDLTDELVRKKRAQAVTQLMLGRGRAQSFSQGDMGDLNIGKQKLGGGQ